MLRLKHHDSDGLKATEHEECHSLDMVAIVTKWIRVDALVAASTQVERRNDQ